jgi:alcohol dehydrogenase class IV
VPKQSILQSIPDAEKIRKFDFNGKRSGEAGEGFRTTTNSEDNHFVTTMDVKRPALAEAVSARQVNDEGTVLSDKDVEHTVKWALNDISYEGNPRDMTGDDIRKIMKAMM